MSLNGVLGVLFSPYEAAGIIIMVIALVVHAAVDLARATRSRDSKEK
jgi:hypothetical protein